MAQKLNEINKLKELQQLLDSHQLLSHDDQEFVETVIPYLTDLETVVGTQLYSLNFGRVMENFILCLHLILAVFNIGVFSETALGHYIEKA